VLLEIEGSGVHAHATVDSPSGEKRTDKQSAAQDTSEVLQTSANVATKQPETVQKQPPKRIKAAPYTRKVARENDVDIEQVEGTGPKGRITVEDIHRFKASIHSPEKMQAEEPLQNESATIPFTGIRKQIANKMTGSLKTIPHVTH